jgi:DNA-binding CsgD family transcriptional regulator/tetratricopeptide (TPR) repeat protein
LGLEPPYIGTLVLNSALLGDTAAIRAMELLERQTQLDELAQHLRERGSGAGKIVFVSGEAGAGKSSLVETFSQHVPRGTRVLWGHSDALQTSRVLGPVNELIAGLSLLPDAPRDPGMAREQLFSRLFERLSQPNPATVVVLEDLHWADEATLDFVRFLGRRIQRTRCLFIGTYRDDELAPTHQLRAILGELTGQHTARMRVPALTLEAVEQLARGTRLDAHRIYEVTGGNAFFVRELLAAPTDTVPETVRDAVLTRLMQCSQPAREIAEIVSLVPGRTEHWLTRTMLGDVSAAADEAVSRGLLRFVDSTLVFRHELGRLAVESTVSRIRATELHAGILRILIEHEADLSRLVHHASRAQDVKAMLEYAPRAAEEAARAGSHREAAAHLSTAIRHAEKLGTAERARLYELHAIECNVSNDFNSSLSSAGRALALWRELGDVAAQARALILIGRQYWKSGQKALADRHVADAIALLETLPPGRELAMAYSARSQLAMTSGQLTETLEFGQRALDLATRINYHYVTAHALNNMGTAVLAAGDRAGLEKLERSLRISLEHDMHEDAGRAYSNLVSVAVREHFHDIAERYVNEGISYSETHDVQDSLAYLRANAAHFDLNMGRWSDAARVASELVEHHALAVPQRLPALVVHALVRARRGERGVDAIIDEALRLALPTGELQRIGRVAAARAEIAWYRGDLKRVAQEAAIGLNAAVGQRDMWAIGELFFWARRANPALELSEELPEPYALMVDGEWKHAAAAWEKLEMPYERAMALAEGPEDALRESLTILEALGAGPLAALVRQRLRNLGARGITRGPRTTTRGNPAGLTAREIQVLRLLMQGHTNTELARRLHCSAKTVGHHVSSILEKLEVHSRTEAVAVAFRLGIAKSPE